LKAIKLDVASVIKEATPGTDSAHPLFLPLPLRPSVFQKLGENCDGTQDAADAKSIRNTEKSDTNTAKAKQQTPAEDKAANIDENKQINIKQLFLAPPERESAPREIKMQRARKSERVRKQQFLAYNTALCRLQYSLEKLNT